MESSQWRSSTVWTEVPSEWVDLPGGALEVGRFGRRGGTPLLFFHGWPSSLCQAHPASEKAAELGFDLIAVNRPGIGASAPRPALTVAGWPALMRELLDALGLERTAILGVSGGAPYALACGALEPEHFPQISIACGAPPLGGDYRDWRRDTSRVYQLLGGLAERFPAIVDRAVDLAVPLLRRRPPWWLYQLGARPLSAGDRQAIGNPDISEYSFGSFQGAMASGGRRVIEEGRRYLEPWGFELADVEVPVTVWHGIHDKNFHWSLAERVVEALPQGRLELRDDHGHYSLVLLIIDEILAELRQRWDHQSARVPQAS